MWTVIPPEQWNGQDEMPCVLEQVICRSGIRLSVTSEDAGGYRVRRILSTDPKDFLCAEISPGTVIR